jgi:hypothetical protein
MKTSPEELKLKLGVLIFRVDFVQVKTAIYQDETVAVIRINQEKTEAAIKSIWVELEEAMKLRVEDVLVSIEQLTQDLHEELSERSSKRSRTHK